MGLSLPDLTSARDLHEWLADGGRGDRSGWPRVAGLAPRWPGAADLYAQLLRSFNVPRTASSPAGCRLRWDPPGWPQHVSSPLSTLTCWAYASSDDPIPTRVGDLAVAYQRLLEARRAARDGGGSRKYLKGLAERVAGLTAAAVDEWRRTRLDLDRWTDGWTEEPATSPRQPLVTNRRGNSWR